MNDLLFEVEPQKSPELQWLEHAKKIIGTVHLPNEPLPWTAVWRGPGIEDYCDAELQKKWPSREAVMDAISTTCDLLDDNGWMIDAVTEFEAVDRVAANTNGAVKTFDQWRAGR